MGVAWRVCSWVCDCMVGGRVWEGVMRIVSEDLAALKTLIPAGRKYHEKGWK